MTTRQPVGQLNELIELSPSSTPADPDTFPASVWARRRAIPTTDRIIRDALGVQYLADIEYIVRESATAAAARRVKTGDGRILPVRGSSPLDDAGRYRVIRTQSVG